MDTALALIGLTILAVLLGWWEERQSNKKWKQHLEKLEHEEAIRTEQQVGEEAGGGTSRSGEGGETGT